MRRRTYEVYDIDSRQGRQGVSGWLIAICLFILIAVAAGSVLYYGYNQVRTAYETYLYQPSEQSNEVQTDGFHLLVAGIHPSTYPEPDLDQLTYASLYRFNRDNQLVDQTFYQLTDQMTLDQQTDIALMELPQFATPREVLHQLESYSSQTADYTMYVSFHHIRPVVDFFGYLTVELSQPITIRDETFEAGVPLQLNSRQVSLLVSPQPEDDWFKLQERQQAILDGVLLAVSNQPLSPGHLTEMIQTMEPFIVTTLPFNLIAKQMINW